MKQDARARFLFLNTILILKKRFDLYQQTYGENHDKIQTAENELCVRMFATNFFLLQRVLIGISESQNMI